MDKPKPPYALVDTGPKPEKAGPSKNAWEETQARLLAPDVKRQADSARRRAERFQESFVKFHSNRGNR